MNIIDEKWQGRMLHMAHVVAGWSKDTSTKVGAVITTPSGEPVSWGFNGFPMGVDDTVPARHVRPEKYSWVAHAERNAIDLSSRADLTGCVLFVTLAPCSACAQSIIQRKIAAVVVDENHTADKVPLRWQENMNIAMTMLHEAGVHVLSGKPTWPDNTVI